MNKLLLYALAVLPCGISNGHPGHEHPALPTTATLNLSDIIGHGELRYRVNTEWGASADGHAPLVNAHAMVEDCEGQIYLVTDHPDNAFVVYEKDGTFVRAFGGGIAGGHGIDLITLDGEEYLVHIDAGWHSPEGAWQFNRVNGGVTIVSKQGDIRLRLPSPHELGLYEEGTRYQPCDVAITPDNDILVVDGYSTDQILHYRADGTFVGVWGGRAADQPGHLQNAHGISIDNTDPAHPVVWVSSRDENKLKAFTLEGEYLDTIDLPGAYAGQAFFRDGKIYTGVCWSKENGTGDRLANSGFVLVLDRETHQILSVPGGTEPVYNDDGTLQPMHQADSVFKHVHDLYVDTDGNIYVGEWNAGGRYPYKLELIQDRQ